MILLGPFFFPGLPAAVDGADDGVSVVVMVVVVAESGEGLDDSEAIVVKQSVHSQRG